MFIHDRNDGDVPVAHGEQLAAAFASSELVLTAGLGHRRMVARGGHFPHLGAPDAVTAALRGFLEAS